MLNISFSSCEKVIYNCDLKTIMGTKVTCTKYSVQNDNAWKGKGVYKKIKVMVVTLTVLFVCSIRGKRRSTQGPR